MAAHDLAQVAPFFKRCSGTDLARRDWSGDWLLQGAHRSGGGALLYLEGLLCKVEDYDDCPETPVFLWLGCGEESFFATPATLALAAWSWQRNWTSVDVGNIAERYGWFVVLSRDPRVRVTSEWGFGTETWLAEQVLLLPEAAMYSDVTGYFQPDRPGPVRDAAADR